MKRTAVESKALSAIGYDADSKVLEVEFSSGRIYQYLDVEPSTYEWLLTVPNKGGVFNRMIRDRYAEREVSEEPESQDLLSLLSQSLNKEE